MHLKKRFHKYLLRSGCIPSGGRILVAVSGGADSVALLSLLCQVSDSLNLHVEVAHLDHAFRKESQDDAFFVAKLCADLGLHFTAVRQDVAEICRQRKGNLEEVARDVRRSFLLSTAQARGCHLIALGHHADDQSETFLLRLLRGSRAAGLAGMRLTDASIVRPLLTFSREELLSYLHEEGLSWCEDKSNLDQTLTRNRIRHNLLPILEGYNPKISRQLSALCSQMRQDEDFWADLVARELPRYGKWSEGEYILDRPLLLGSPPALTGRLLRAALQQVRCSLRGITAAHTADMMALLDEGPPQAELDLPGAWVARRYDRLLIRKIKPDNVEPFAVELSAPGSCLLPDGRTLSLSLVPFSLGESLNAVEFSATSLPLPLQLRYCQQGDRLRPSGMEGTKKLQDLFVDLKLTKEKRQHALVLLMDNEVIWVVGLRRSEGRLPVSGEPILRIVIETKIDS
jgi:tRNA(Ile)-lysidine synthase